MTAARMTQLKAADAETWQALCAALAEAAPEYMSKNGKPAYTYILNVAGVEGFAEVTAANMADVAAAVRGHVHQTGKAAPATPPAATNDEPPDWPADDTPAPVAQQPAAPPTAPKPAPVAKPPKSSPKPAAPPVDDLDEYGDTVKIADPIQPVNRGMFWLNHQLYTYIARPVSKVYRTILPKPVRTAVHNVYDNAEYPVRVVNHLLQGKPGRADLETRKFLLNSTAGVGGIFKPSDRFPSLAEVPSADTGQTFAKWGIGHGAYVVLPVIGPRSVRDTVGLAGDVALNPLTWVPFGGVAQAISIPLSTPNTVRNVDSRLNAYDAATENAVDPYISLRGSYIQYREKAASK